MTIKTTLSIAAAMAIGIQTAHANNVVVDMSQVQDYNQYQMDLQQCEGLAVQNQPDAPQSEAVAGTAVRGAAAGAVTSAGLPLPKLGVAQAHRRPTRVFS